MGKGFCSGLIGLNQFQRKILPRAVRDYQTRNPEILDFDSAGLAFIQSQNYHAWASGVKARYCNFLCPISGDCDIVYDRPHYPQEDVELPLIRQALDLRGLGFIYPPSLDELRAEVGRNKWYLSQKRNWEVDWNCAENDYVHNYLEDFERGFCMNEPPEEVLKELETKGLREVLCVGELVSSLNSK